MPNELKRRVCPTRRLCGNRDTWMSSHRAGYLLAMAVAVSFLGATPLRAGITESQVLVVYNSNSPDGTVLKNYYLAAHPGIPAANVLDLNNFQLNAPELSYSQFVTLVRNPIRNYLLQPGAPDPADIVAICIIRPLAHRILDTDSILDGRVGDSPVDAGDETVAGDSTYAAVDAELALLWQNLDTGEAGGMMDSKSDNFIANPYYKSSATISGFTRTNIQTAKSFINRQNIAWVLGGAGATALTPGDMYLVCRIDGNSLADAQAEIDRAKNLYVNKSIVKVLFDEWDTSVCGDADNDGLFTLNDPFYGGDDYELARDALLAGNWVVRYDATFNFIDSTEETGPVIGYSSYGENHHDLNDPACGEDPPNHGVYIAGFHFPPGAIFNTLESYNGRQFNDIPPLTVIVQEQISHFIEVGGTFGVGSVWEPFSFSIPDSAFLMPNMLINGLTFAEAAYTSLPALSWQQIAVGDPLGKMTILNDPATPRGDMNGDGRVDGRDIAWFIDVVRNGPARYRTFFPALDPIGRGDFDGDFKVTTTDLPGFVNAVLTAP